MISSCKIQVAVDFFTLDARPEQMPEPNESTNSNIALLVCNVLKGRLPDARISGAALFLRIGAAEIARKFRRSDDTWKNCTELTEGVIHTIEVLVREGLSASRIAEVLKRPEALINKVMAHCLDSMWTCHSTLAFLWIPQAFQMD